MGREEVLRLEAYLKEKLNPGLRLVGRKETDDSVEVYLGTEFLAVVYKDTDEGAYRTSNISATSGWRTTS